MQPKRSAGWWQLCSLNGMPWSSQPSTTCRWRRHHWVPILSFSLPSFLFHLLKNSTSLQKYKGVIYLFFVSYLVFIFFITIFFLFWVLFFIDFLFSILYFSIWFHLIFISDLILMILIFFLSFYYYYFSISSINILFYFISYFKFGSYYFNCYLFYFESFLDWIFFFNFVSHSLID